MVARPLTHSEKISKLVSSKLAKLEAPGTETTRSKLHVILHDCGWKKRGSENLERIQAAFEEAGTYPEPMLTAPGIDWDQMIYFSREKPDPYFPDWYAPQHAFPTEKSLQRFLVQNFSVIPEFLDLKQPQMEYKLPSELRVDILCRERRSNAYVAIELKKARRRSCRPTARVPHRARRNDFQQGIKTLCGQGHDHHR